MPMRHVIDAFKLPKRFFPVNGGAFFLPYALFLMFSSEGCEIAFLGIKFKA
jgi:hypothetical protein